MIKIIPKYNNKFTGPSIHKSNNSAIHVFVTQFPERTDIIVLKNNHNRSLHTRFDFRGIDFQRFPTNIF